MRWKLLIIASLAAAFVGCVLWSMLVIGAFGNARTLARNDWLLLSTMVLPLVVAVYSGIFVYRHTARRRKTQATITVVLALVLSLVAYLMAWAILPDRLYIPRSYEVRHAR
jgi:cytochrome bd-type quinol oxidase subunit 2